MMIKTFTLLIQNSSSPNHCTPKRFMRTMATRKTAIKTPGLTLSRGTQYCRTKAVAVSWVGTFSRYLNQ